MASVAFHVDPQKGFSCHCPKELPVKDAQDIVEGLNLMSSLCDLSVVSKECHPATAKWLTNDPSKIGTPIDKPESKHYDVYWPAHCMSGTEGSDLLPGLPAVTEYDYVVWKGMEDDLHPYGACFHDADLKLSTGVIEWMQSKGVKTVVVGGLALDYCVLHTLLQLITKSTFTVAICAFATKAVVPENSETVLQQLATKGVVVLRTPDELKRLLRSA